MNPLHVKLGAAALAILIVGAAGGYWLAQRTEPGDAGATPHGDRKVLYWHDPMVPNARFDKPGKSPFMDMQLVPVYADETGGGAVPSPAGRRKASDMKPSSQDSTSALSRRAGTGAIGLIAATLARMPSVGIEEA